MSIPFLPSRASRDLTSDQLINVGGRMGEALLAPEDGLPEGDAVVRRMAEQIMEGTVHLGLRVRMERRSRFTKEKARQEKLRDDYVGSIRKGIRAVWTDKDPALPAGRREAAGLLRDLLEKRAKNFEKKSGGENTTQLEFLVADLETASAQAALKETNLLRYYIPLQEAHAAYLRVVKEEAAAEAASAMALPSENPRRLPEMRVLKETLTARIRLTLEVIDFMAEQGVAPYGNLMKRCAVILSEAGFVAKARQTRAARSKAGLTA